MINLVTNNINQGIPMEAIIGTYNIKFNRLQQIVNSAYYKSNAYIVNIFIDLYSIVSQIYTARYDNIGILCEEAEFSSDIINLCAHYRSYFNSINVQTKFFIVYGLCAPIENVSTMYPAYNAKFLDQYNKKGNIRRNIELNIDYLKIICNYIPGIYFFDAKDKEVSGYIDYLLTNFGLIGDPRMENIVITKDRLPYQLVSRGCVIFRPLKYKGVDSSYYIDINNLWDVYGKESRYTTSLNTIPSVFFTNVLAMTSFPDRNMKWAEHTTKITTAIDIIKSILDSGYITIQNMYNEYSQEVLNKVLEVLDYRCNYMELLFRWRCINARFASQFIIPNNPILSNVQLIDLDDPNGVRQINNTIYEKCPIDLDRL